MLPRGNTTLETIADLALVAVYVPVMLFFAYRWRVHRQPASLGIAVLPFGWLFVALWDLGVLPPLPWAPIRWVGVGSGILLLLASLSTERRDPRGRVRR